MCVKTFIKATPIIISIKVGVEKKNSSKLLRTFVFKQIIISTKSHNEIFDLLSSLKFLILFRNLKPVNNKPVNLKVNHRGR